MLDSRALPPELLALPSLVMKSDVALGDPAKGERDLALALVAAVLPPGAAAGPAHHLGGRAGRHR